jgi:hypothetical protein
MRNLRGCASAGIPKDPLAALVERRLGDGLLDARLRRKVHTAVAPVTPPSQSTCT